MHCHTPEHGSSFTLFHGCEGSGGGGGGGQLPEMDPDPFLEKCMLGELGSLSQQLAALQHHVGCEDLLGFSFIWHPEICLPRPISGRRPCSRKGLDPMGQTHSDPSSHGPVIEEGESSSRASHIILTLTGWYLLVRV